MPPEKVPDALRQKFFPYENGYQLDYSKHICVRDGCDCSVKFFRNSSGEFVNFVALHCGNLLTICRIMEDRLENHYVFPEELIIKDIEYIRCIDNGYGLVVALNSTKVNVHSHCIALLHCKGGQLQLVRMLGIDQEITCLKVISDAQDMIHLHPLLHPKMASWPHIIAVGTYYAHCYLFHFDQIERHHETEVRVPLSTKLTDGLKPFHDGDAFVYTYVDEYTGNTRSKRFSRESVHVSCISFLERSRTVLLGFSFGGIMSISLTSSPTIDPLIYPCGASVRFIAPMEPDDDPRTHLWFFVAYDSTKAKSLQLCLYEVMFPEEESLPISERTWDKPIFAIKLVIPIHNSSRWISLQTLVRERTEARGGDDSTRDSYKLGSEKDKSLVFFTYVANDRNGCNMKGGLFDLNAYYYKRLVHVIVHDGTAAQQCAFMSVVHSIPMHFEKEDFSLVKDSIVDPSYITRFISNVSDAEQMFYPSALEIFVVYVAGTRMCYQFTLPSLPNQLLSTICADLEMHMADPKSPSTWLSALGFYKKEAYSATDQYEHLCSVLSVLISHQRAGAIVQFIKHCDSLESRHLVSTWIWEEIDKASKKLHETIAPLFARFSAPLSPAGKKSLAHVHDVFIAGVQIIRELVSTGERERDETKEYMTSLKAQRFAVENLLSYSTVIHQLIYSKILPVAEDREIRLAMEESLKERRSNIPGGQLNVDKLVTRMRKRSPSEPFWHAEGPLWYPPALLNLLGPILLLNIPTKWKGQLLAFYLLDYASCKAEHLSDSDLSPNLIDLVTKQMHGILSMNKEEIRNVYKMWCADCGKLMLEESPKQSSPCFEELPANLEAKRLMSIPRTLSAVEEKKLKSLLESIPLGNFRWQCYLAKNRRYNEIAELHVPLNADNDESVLEYLQLLPAIKLLRRNDFSSISRPAWPSSIKEAVEKFEHERYLSQSSYEGELPVLNRGKTPIPLSKLNSKISPLHGCKGAALTTLQQFNKTFPLRMSEQCDTSPSAKSTDLDSSENDEILPRDIPTNTLNNITDILRTPKARACAAAQAESQRKWVEKTPEGEIQMAAPRSILKSAKLDRGGSPSRTRLHFDLPSSTSSSVAPSTSPANNSDNFERICQPNFDESLEYDGNEAGIFAETEERVDIAAEEFAPLVSPDSTQQCHSQAVSSKTMQANCLISQDTEGVLQKSFEVQDEDEEVGDYRRSTVDVEEQDEDIESNVEDTSEIYFEQQEEDEIAQDRNVVILDENYRQQKKDRKKEKNQSAISLEERKLGTFMELQEESCEVDIIAAARCKDVASAKVALAAVPRTSYETEGPLISPNEMEFDNENEEDIHKGYEDNAVDDSATSILVSGDHISVVPDSVNTSVTLNSTLEVSHVKLVDYSFSNTTFENTSASRTLHKAYNVFMDEDNAQELPQYGVSDLMEIDDRHDVDFDKAECGVACTTNEYSDYVDPFAATSMGNSSTFPNHMGFTAADTESVKSVVLPTSPSQPFESQSSSTSSASRQRSSKKSGHTSVLDTPIRHSMRLRGRIVEPNVEETEGGDIQNTDAKLLRTPLRKRTRKESCTSETDYSVPRSTRKSPARKRKTTEDCQSLELDLEIPTVIVNEEPDDGTSDTTFHRVSRTRRPSRARPEVLATPVSKTPRLSRRTSENDIKGNSGRQPIDVNERRSCKPFLVSCTTRNGNQSTTDIEEHASVVESSPSRRTTMRYTAKSKGSRSPSTSGRSSSRSKALNELQGRLTIPESLGGLDARSFFDMVTEQKMAEVQSNRRRTVSDSGISNMKPKSRKKKVCETIDEVEEGPGNRKTPSRPRRTASASLLEETSSRLTEEQSEIVPETLHTPRSSRRKRQTRQICPIPE